MTNLNRAKLIALDWGTSSCRAYLMGEGSVVLSERQEPSGVMAITARAGASGTPYKVAFGRAFEALCGEWLGSVPGLPVIACGMVGRNKGWVEAEYRTVPSDLAANGLVLTPVRTQAGTTVHIVPGLIVNSALPGVMRGEETQILGALTHDLKAGTVDYAAHRIVLSPGTHSKWVRITGTTVTDFTTCMTGEIYALLTADREGCRGLPSARTDRTGRPSPEVWPLRSPTGRGGILNTAFSARTLVMTGELAPGRRGTGSTVRPT
jgi:2-dehydro-3-deoxygalactonokinase